MHQKVTGLTPGPNNCPGCGLGPCFFSFSPPPLSSLSNHNNIFFKGVIFKALGFVGSKCEKKLVVPLSVMPYMVLGLWDIKWPTPNPAWNEILVLTLSTIWFPEIFFWITWLNLYYLENDPFIHRFQVFLNSNCQSVSNLARTHYNFN